MELDRAIALYMNDCRARQLRPKTMLAYEQALKLFAVWLVDTFGMTAIGKITADHIRKYIIDLQERGKYTFCINSSSCAFNHPQNRRDYPSLMNEKMNVSELARICGLSRPAVYKYLKMLG